MEEITLICAETNTEYKIKVSSEDATKARIGKYNMIIFYIFMFDDI